MVKILDIQGASLPALGFGTWSLSSSRCREMVCYAIELGYRHIDTATIYGNEVEVGQGIAASGISRDEIFLVTKVWTNNLRFKAVLASAEESLRRLDTDYVDLLLVHWPTRSVPLSETLDAMSELRSKGRIRHVGVSNFNVALMREAVEVHGVKLLANQVEYHPYLSQNRVLDYARSRGMTVTAYSPVAKGRVTRDPALKRIARKHGKSPAQVALRWLIEQDAVSAIPKAGDPAHCRANIEIFDFELDDEDRNEIDALPKQNRITDMSSGYAWDPD